MVTRSRRRKQSQSSKLRKIKIGTVSERKRKRQRKIPKVPRFEKDSSKPLYHHKMSPPTPISPRIYKFPSSMGISPRLGSISVPVRDRLPQLSLSVEKEDPKKGEFLVWKDKVNSELRMLGSPKHTDDLPDCNLRDMFDQNVHCDNAARVVFRKKIMLDDHEDHEEFDVKEQNRLFREWKKQVNRIMKRRYGLTSVDSCRDLNWRDMFDQGVLVDRAVGVARKICAQ